MPTMTAVGSFHGSPLSDPAALVDVEVPRPVLRPRDVLVRVEAVSVNPADTKVRAGLAASTEPRILGFDASGTVVAIGTEVDTLAIGDEVYYAGDITRPGANADYQAVDERIVARKPRSLSFAEAAAIPLTALTAWESLIERFGLGEASDGALVIVGGAGGVGSALIQLARALTAVRIIATASRPESSAWAIELGAHAVVDHRTLVASVREIAPHGVDYLFSAHSSGRIADFAEVVKPFGAITAIDEPRGLDLLPLKSKSISWHWELMFTRAMYETPDMSEQKLILERVAELVDTGRFRTTVTRMIPEFTAAGLRRAHDIVESGRAIGKVVVHRASAHPAVLNRGDTE